MNKVNRILVTLFILTLAKTIYAQDFSYNPDLDSAFYEGRSCFYGCEVELHNPNQSFVPTNRTRPRLYFQEEVEVYLFGEDVEGIIREIGRIGLERPAGKKSRITVGPRFQSNNSELVNLLTKKGVKMHMVFKW
jgi:hypothetical protein